MTNVFGDCPECGYPLEAVWFTEEEYKITSFGSMYRTGRKRRAVDYLICDFCGKSSALTIVLMVHGGDNDDRIEILSFMW